MSTGGPPAEGAGGSGDRWEGGCGPRPGCDSGGFGGNMRRRTPWGKLDSMPPGPVPRPPEPRCPIMRLVPAWLVLPFLVLLPALSGVGPAQVPGEPGNASEAMNPTETLDLLLRGGHVLDGTGNPAFRADVGVRDGRIVAVGRLAEVQARDTLDVAGRVVAPGFIDIHSHASFTTDDAWTRAAPSLVAQGITTVV
ncbi:MAG: hypothetical protein EA352_03890, partial [Gemmatimonadales bacterium]